MPAITAWSWSRYECWEQCPLKFKFKFIDKLPEPQSPAMARGNTIHVATAKYITGQSIEMPKEAAHFAWLLNELRALPADHKLIEQQWGFTSSWRATGWFGSDTWFRAILDAAAFYDDDTAEGVDWKSGKKYASNKDQVELFGASMLFKFPSLTKVTTRLVYFDANDQDFDEVLGKDREKLKAKWGAKATAMFADTTFTPRPNDKCRFCHWRQSNGGPCRFG